MEKKKNLSNVPKIRFKDLCKEDKAKFGELIDELATEKRRKRNLEDQIDELKEQANRDKKEKSGLIDEKEKIKAKLDRSMDLIKELTKTLNTPKVSVYTQTNFLDDFTKFSQTEYVSSIYDEKFYKIIEKIEKEDTPSIDPLLLNIIKELENTD
jgi:predicted DNA-binding ribbon-helix-helix protein